jgi:hypothetical protein
VRSRQRLVVSYSRSTAVRARQVHVKQVKQGANVQKLKPPTFCFLKMSASASGAAPPAKRQKSSSTSSSSSTAAPVILFSSSRWVNAVPVEVWREHICQKLMDLQQLSIMRRCHTFFEKYWQNMMRKNVIRVPQGCPTVDKAMELAVVFSERKVYTEADPLKIQLDQGVHEIVGDGAGYMRVTCSHITFVGKGKDHTTVLGGFKVDNQQNIKFEELL